MNAVGGKMKKILYVSSSGGHYAQLSAYIKNTGIDAEKVVVSPSKSTAELPGCLMLYLKDTNIRDPFGVLRCTFFFLKLFVNLKPDLIISTGAAPGAIAIAIGRLFGVSGVWVDSMANAKAPSLSGKLVKGIAKVWITQSDVVANECGGIYNGKVFNIY